MAIDWATERYVRLFVRDTDDDQFLSWQARAIWHQFLRRCDESGLLSVRRGELGIAKMLDFPLEVIQASLPELLEDGRLRVVAAGYAAPNFVLAQFTPRADKARAAQARAVKTFLGRDSATVGQGAIVAQGAPSDADSGHPVTERQGEPHISQGVFGEDADNPVTSRHAQSHDVTRSHAAFSDQIKAKHNKASQSARAKRAYADSASPIPGDWQPKPSEITLAEKLGITNLDAVAGEFRAFWVANQGKKANWDAQFASRLNQLVRQRGERSSSAGAAQPTKATKWL